LILPHDATERLVGFRALRQSGPDAGEVKRLYVRPEANSHRLGRALVDVRIQTVRDMGWRPLFNYAITDNRDILWIYESIGFQPVDRYLGCVDLVDMQYDLQCFKLAAI
jgi:putative acetyltransferase